VLGLVGLELGDALGAAEIDLVAILGRGKDGRVDGLTFDRALGLEGVALCHLVLVLGRGLGERGRAHAAAEVDLCAVAVGRGGLFDGFAGDWAGNLDALGREADLLGADLVGVLGGVGLVLAHALGAAEVDRPVGILHGDILVDGLAGDRAEGLKAGTA